jgi:multiple sugar transport system substrate-binding protein
MRRRYSRRDFLKMGGAGLAGATMLGAAACGGGGGQNGGPTNLVFTFGPSGSEDERTTQELVDRFNEQNQGEIQVEFQQRSSVTDEYFQSLVSDFGAGAEPPVDVIAGDVVWSAEFAQNGWIEDLSRRMYSDYEPQVPDGFLNAPMGSVSFQNSLWSVPWFTDVGLLYYRRDLLEDAGFGQAPTTWSGLKEIANQVKEQAGTQYGFVFQGADYEGGVVNGAEYIWNAGGEMLVGNVTVIESDRPRSISPNVVTIDSPSSVQGLTTERSMIADGIAPEDVTDFREQDSYEAFLNGDAVFMRGWPFMYALAGQEDFSVSPDQVGVAALPVEQEGLQSWSCLGGWNMYMNSASQNKDAAWEFIKFMTAPEQQKFRALEGSFLPTLTSLYEDQEILDQVPVIDLASNVILDNARTRPVTPFYSNISRRLASGFNASLSGETEPEQVIQNLQSELENIIRQRG